MKRQHIVRREDGSILIINYEDFCQLQSQPMGSILPSSNATSNILTSNEHTRIIDSSKISINKSKDTDSRGSSYSSKSDGDSSSDSQRDSSDSSSTSSDNNSSDNDEIRSSKNHRQTEREQNRKYK